MKTYIAKFFVLAAISLAVGVNSTRALGATYTVGVPPHNTPKQGAELFQGLLVFMLDTAVPGDEITVCDALNQKLVTRFVIPEGKLFQANAKARAQRLAAPMTALKQFLLTEHSYPAELAGVIALPQFLDFAATQLRRPDQPLRVVILASPFYMDGSGEGACSMDTAVPSDAHLTAEQQYSPFGCALRKRNLSGVAVHYAYLNAKFLNDYHQERITRFWALYCQQAGGVLATFCADAAIAFQRAKENIQQPCVAAQLDSSDKKIEMRQVVRRGVITSQVVTNLVGRVATTSTVPRVVTSTTVVETNIPALNRPPVAEPIMVQTTNPLAPPVVLPVTMAVTNPPSPEIVKLAEAFPVKATTNKLVVGIAWSADVDLDLWVRANPAAAELYYNNKSTREGRYLHDWRKRNLGVDYEYVELNPREAVDVAEVGAWVNYYQGSASPIRGVVVVIYEGLSYFGEFTLAAPGGNRSGEKDKREQSRYWMRLNLAELIKSGNKLSPIEVTR
ncbi:MAG: hypothetical protein NTZ16_14310 [Verrucomicrobia bacterium]|nr:hypothetical protein [Verrucomicrobiota bacterium]